MSNTVFWLFAGFPCLCHDRFCCQSSQYYVAGREVPAYITVCQLLTGCQGVILRWPGYSQGLPYAFLWLDRWLCAFTSLIAPYLRNWLLYLPDFIGTMAAILRLAVIILVWRHSPMCEIGRYSCGACAQIPLSG